MSSCNSFKPQFLWNRNYANSLMRVAWSAEACNLKGKLELPLNAISDYPDLVELQYSLSEALVSLAKPSHLGSAFVVGWPTVRHNKAH